MNPIGWRVATGKGPCDVMGNVVPLGWKGASLGQRRVDFTDSKEIELQNYFVEGA